MNTTNINKSKPNKCKAWFRSSFMPPGQETHRAYSTALGTHMRHITTASVMLTCLSKLINESIAATFSLHRKHRSRTYSQTNVPRGMSSRVLTPQPRPLVLNTCSLQLKTQHVTLASVNMSVVSFRYSAPVVWNSLPRTVLESLSISLQIQA